MIDRLTAGCRAGKYAPARDSLILSQFPTDPTLTIKPLIKYFALRVDAAGWLAGSVGKKSRSLVAVR